MALGKTVKSLRLARGWTLKDLSKRSGVPVGTIGALEVRDSVRSEYALQLAQGLEVSLDSILLASGDISSVFSQQNYPLAPIQQAQTAINGVVSLDQGLDSLIAHLEQVSPAKRAAVSGLMAALAADPEDPQTRAALAAMLTPAAFVEPQKTGTQNR